MADSRQVDAALLALLRADAALTAALPDGIHFALATQGAQTFGLVSIVSAREQAMFGPPGQRCAFEDITYRVEAVTLEKSPTAGLDAAARIEQLLEDAVLTVPGYTPMSVERLERVRYPEPDPVDPSMIWQHAGAQFRVLAAPVYA